MSTPCTVCIQRSFYTHCPLHSGNCIDPIQPESESICQDKSWHLCSLQFVKREERGKLFYCKGLFIKEIIIFRNTCQVGHLFREEWFNMAPKSVQVWVYSSILIFRKREGNNLWSLYELYFVVLSSVQRSETYVEYFVKSGLQEWETFWMFSNFENFKSKK